MEVDIEFLKGEFNMTHLFFELDGYKVSYYVKGNDKKPTIVCLHGLAGSAIYSFSEISKILSEHFNIILIDQPGHGKSSPFNNEEHYLFSNLAAWYEKVFDYLSIKQCYILGHSWGADVVLHYAKNYPAKVKGVILLDGGFTFPTFQDEMTFSNAYNGWNNYMDSAKFNHWKDIVSEFSNYTKRWNDTLEQSLSTIFNKNEKYELIATKDTVLSIIKAFFEEPFTTTYQFIKSPLLLIHATEPEELYEARKKGISKIKNDVEDSSIISLLNTGHMIQWDKPIEVSSEITRWIRNIENKTSQDKEISS